MAIAAADPAPAEVITWGARIDHTPGAGRMDRNFGSAD